MKTGEETFDSCSAPIPVRKTLGKRAINKKCWSMCNDHLAQASRGCLCVCARVEVCQVCVHVVGMSIWHEGQTGEKVWKQGKENIDQSCTANVNS